MEKYLKEIQWFPLFSETMKRLEYFKVEFRKSYSEEELTDDKLDEAIVYSCGAYGQGELYEIWTESQAILEDKETLSDVFKEFCEVIKKSIDDSSMQPKNYIFLFIEYLWAAHIKR